MNSTRAPNHPVTYSSHFEPLAKVSHVSVTNGHQLGKFKAPGMNTSLPGPGDSKKKLTKFSPKVAGKGDAPNKLPLAGTSKAANQSVFSKLVKTSLGIRQDTITTPTKGKQKAVEPLDDKEEQLFDNGIDNEVNQDDEPNNAPKTPPKRGRPCKSIIQEAAKRMKKF
ncbi:hypothetical protein PtA15_14A211 [Puccinia triticina]|uniref:Uncharacterized protein n=1 Tax=Puccinia triticina TaxID=208348 RepID=A0ABY7D178_9BASI|nr:uncharacterized protein PtA15_14A211 [Puccinia triticina]WAQ91328.1 hypothetical protein PtA15_14A211 [Puccinia triticina]